MTIISGKSTSGILIVFLLCTFLYSVTLAQNNDPYSGIVVIKSDGSIEPSNAPVEKNNNVYSLTNSIVGNVTIQIDDITFDGAGYSIEGIEILDEVTIGLDVPFRNNVSITNLKVTNLVNGIRLLNSTNCIIYGNNIIDNIDGLRLDNSTNNIVWGNNITTNYHGIHPFSGSTFYLNNFVGNDEHVRFPVAEYPNVWDDGYPVGGNYWGNYTGVDQKQGENQDIDGSDGLGDTPHVIVTSLNSDRYPQMVPYLYQSPEEPMDEFPLIYVVVIGLFIVGVFASIIFLRKRS
jgi:parallel beta-helix repeat protein